MRQSQRLIMSFVANRDRPEKKVAVAADIFGESLHGNVDTVDKGVEIDAGGPSVVEDDEGADFVSGFGNCRNVLNFHADGAWTFAPDEARVLLKERTDLPADGRRIKGDFNA